MELCLYVQHSETNIKEAKETLKMWPASLQACLKTEGYFEPG